MGQLRAPGYLHPTDSHRRRMPIILKLKRKLRAVGKGHLLLPGLEALPVYTGELYAPQRKNNQGESKRLRRHATKRQRELRKERSDAIAAVLLAASHYVSAISRVLFHKADTGEKVGLRIPTIAERVVDPETGEAGMNTRRIDRCIQNLRDAGYLHSTERCEKDDDKPRGYKGFPAVRQFTMKLIEHLGLGDAWRKASKHHYQRAKAKRDAARTAAAGDAELAALRHRGQRPASDTATEPRLVGAVLADTFEPPS